MLGKKNSSTTHSDCGEEYYDPALSEFTRHQIAAFAQRPIHDNRLVRLNNAGVLASDK